MGTVVRHALLGGRLRLKQPRGGYRCSIDAVLLAGFAAPRAGDAVVDLGTGCGVIPLLLATRFPDIRVWGVELQAELAALAAENVRDNGLAARIQVLCADMRAVGTERIGGPADVVVANPPFRKKCSGRINPDRQRALARHEIAITLSELLRVSARLLRTGGRFFVVYTADRLPELLGAMQAERIEPKRLRGVHPAPGEDARMVLVEGARGGRPGAALLPPLVVRDGRGVYTPEVQALLRAPDPRPSEAPV